MSKLQNLSPFQTFPGQVISSGWIPGLPHRFWSWLQWLLCRVYIYISLIISVALRDLTELEYKVKTVTSIEKRKWRRNKVQHALCCIGIYNTICDVPHSFSLGSRGYSHDRRAWSLSNTDSWSVSIYSICISMQQWEEQNNKLISTWQYNNKLTITKTILKTAITA